MKKMKKIASIILAMVMALVMTVPAFATGTEPQANPGSIKISNAVPERVYTAYKIFDVTQGDGNAYSYTVPDAWKPFVQGSGAGVSYVTTDQSGNGPMYVNFKENVTDAELKAFASLALEYAKTYNATESNTEKIPTGSVTAPALAEDATSDTVEATISNLPVGYYVVDSNGGTVCSLGTAGNNSATITEKNPKPTVEKTVTDSDNNNASTAEIGDVLNYTVTITAQPGAEKYVLHDVMNPGLTLLNNSIQVTGSTGLDVTGKYTIKTGDEVSETTGEKCTFEVSFDEDWCKTLTEGQQIIITYQAQVNENAVEQGADNSATLNYGENSTLTTTPATTDTKVYKFTLKKVDATNTNTVLNGAEFKLYDSKVGGNEIPIKEAANKSYYYVANKEKAEADTNGTQFQSDAIVAGEVVVKGLKVGTYYLEEVKAPNGYNRLQERKAVTITADLQGQTTTINVENNKGSLLPSTGGIGTTIFYIIGGILVVGAAVLLVTKKRMSKEA